MGPETTFLFLNLKEDFRQTPNATGSKVMDRRFSKRVSLQQGNDYCIQTANQHVATQMVVCFTLAAILIPRKLQKLY